MPNLIPNKHSTYTICYINSYLYCILTQEAIHISFMWYTASTYSCAWYFVDCHTWSCVAVCFYWRKLFSSFQLNINYVAESCTVETMFCEHIWTIHMCPKYQGIQYSLHAKAPFVTITKCVDYAGILIFKCPY